MYLKRNLPLPEAGLLFAEFTLVLLFVGGVPKLNAGCQTTGSSTGSSTVELLASLEDEEPEIEPLRAVLAAVFVLVLLVFVVLAVVVVAADLAAATSCARFEALDEEVAFDGLRACCGRKAGIKAGVKKLFELT